MKVYLIACESFNLMKSEIDKLVPPNSYVIKYDLRQSALDDVLSEASYFSLTNEQKYIIVKGASFFKTTKSEDEDGSKETKKPENYPKSPNDNTTIIFASYEMPDKRKKLFKLINNENNYIEIPTLNKKELTYKTIELLKNHGYSIAYDTASYIVDNSYVNYDILIGEINKILVLLPKGEINLENIKDIISTSISNKTFNYINAIITKDLKTAINAIDSFEKLKIDPIVVVISLAKEMQIYLNLKQGITPKDIQKNYGKEDWMIKNYLNHLNDFSEKELKKIIITLNNYDLGLKSGAIDKAVALDLLALELCD